MNREAETQAFSKCPTCKKCWATREEFLSDAMLILNGYNADFDSLDNGLFYFSHELDNCGSTLTVQARHFFDLYDGPRYTERKTGTDECPEYCLHLYRLERCEAKCECASIREILQTITKWPKN